jgi:hypothetical protein
MGEKTADKSGAQSPGTPKGAGLRQDNVPNPLKAIRKRIIRCGWISISRLIRETNCLGTALYIAHEKDYDEYVDPITAHNRYLARLRKIDEPVEGCIIALQGNWYWHPLGRVLTDETYTRHAGIIVGLSPLLVAHRKGIRTRFIKSDVLDEVRSHEELRGYELAFYLPRILQEAAYGP